LVNLTYLDISNNFKDNKSNILLDLSPLSNLIKLTHLDLAANNIIDISPLSNLINLTHLDISENFGLKSNDIFDLSPLSNLFNLIKLNLSDNFELKSNIINLTPLTKLNNLEILDLSYNPGIKFNIITLTLLNNLINLKKLNLVDNIITDIEKCLSFINLSTTLKNTDIEMSALPIIYSRNSDHQLVKSTSLSEFDKMLQKILLDDLNITDDFKENNITFHVNSVHFTFYF
jgi:internalin A